MQTSETKKETSKNEVTKKENAIQNLIAGMKLPEKVNSTRESIYKDSTHLNNFDGGKKFRQKMRKKLQNSVLKCLQAFKANDPQKIKESVSEFEKFYSENYKVNNFEVSSLYQGDTEKANFKFYDSFCKIMKEYKKETK